MQLKQKEMSWCESILTEKYYDHIEKLMTVYLYFICSGLCMFSLFKSFLYSKSKSGLSSKVKVGLLCRSQVDKIDRWHHVNKHVQKKR